MRPSEAGDFQNHRVTSLQLAAIAGRQHDARLQKNFAAVKFTEQPAADLQQPTPRVLREGGIGNDLVELQRDGLQASLRGGQCHWLAVGVSNTRTDSAIPGVESCDRLHAITRQLQVAKSPGEGVQILAGRSSDAQRLACGPTGNVHRRERFGMKPARSQPRFFLLIGSEKEVDTTAIRVLSQFGIPAQVEFEVSGRNSVGNATYQEAEQKRQRHRVPCGCEDETNFVPPLIPSFHRILLVFQSSKPASLVCPTFPAPGRL